MGPATLLLALLHSVALGAMGAHEEITVTATGVPTRLVDTASAVTVLDDEELLRTPALTLDEALRTVPGFTLFRRSSSRTANPTTQGPSLRAVGGSGASRALVLADGVPINDPFGGWVAWGRVPQLALAQVEVLRGGASDLYGTGALTGVVQLLRRDASEPAVLAELSAGSERTAEGELWAGAVRGAWRGTLAAERQTSDGYVLVPEDRRGPVDTAAGGDHTSVEARLERASDRGSFSLRAGAFDEDRENGTPLQQNHTELRDVALGADAPLLGGTISLRGWGARETYLQTFTAIADDRASERLIRDQRVPSRQAGVRLRLERALGARQTLLAGGEASRTTGESDERAYVGPVVVPSAAGGRQDLAGLFVEDLVTLTSRVTLSAGLRGDAWRNRAGPGGDATRRARSLSPRLALRWQASAAWSLALSAYRSFRAPTLNELYRSFRVGDVVTQANPELRAERLHGAELGAGWAPRGVRGAPHLRATAFWMDLDDPVANLTVGAIPGATVRRRENLGSTRARGVELEGETALGHGFTAGLSWLGARSRVTSFPPDPTLVGLAVPQVPERQGSLRLAWGAAGWRASVVARRTGTAFEDDRNTMRLGAFDTVDMELARTLGARVELFAAAENALDEEYAVALTPIETRGAPRLLRVGVRLR